MNLSAILALPHWQKVVLPLAWFLLGYYWGALKIRSWRSLTGDMRLQSDMPDRCLVDAKQQGIASDIGKLVALAARYTPWKSLCLARALASSRLLQLWSIPHQIHLGVKANVSAGAKPDLAAHAWLSSGENVVCGLAGHEDYAKICSYAVGCPGTRTMSYG